MNNESTLREVSLTKLVAALREHAAQSKRLKSQLRRGRGAPKREPQPELDKALVLCRRRTTELCILRALMRGKYHLQKPPRDGFFEGMEWSQERYHRGVASRVALDFQEPS